jgi:hypothetical protein
MPEKSDQNGVHSEGEPLKVLIAGAGIGGLCAAIGRKWV